MTKTNNINNVNNNKVNNNIEIFSNDEFGSIRTLNINGEPWFVGRDVAEILGYANASKAVLANVDEDDKTFLMLDIAHSQNGNVPVGQSKTALINESGLYSLILGSKLSGAKKFKRWVTNEVLPSIRKHGVYATEMTIKKPYLTQITSFKSYQLSRKKKKIRKSYK